VETIKYNLTQAKTREEKTQWIKIGIAQKSDRNFWIKLDVLPIADKNGEVWLNLFERKEDEISQKNERKA
jgi:hypothetical protein